MDRERELPETYVASTPAHVDSQLSCGAIDWMGWMLPMQSRNFSSFCLKGANGSPPLSDHDQIDGSLLVIEALFDREKNQHFEIESFALSPPCAAVPSSEQEGEQPLEKI